MGEVVLFYEQLCSVGVEEGDIQVCDEIHEVLVEVVDRQIHLAELVQVVNDMLDEVAQVLLYVEQVEAEVDVVGLDEVLLVVPNEVLVVSDFNPL